MSEILKFVKLDFITLKNAVGFKIVVMLLLVIVLYFFAGLFVLAGMLPMFLPVLTTHNFAAGNDGLDLFYTSLHLKRKNVVFGRYAFILSVNMIALMLFFGLSFFKSEGLEPQLILTQMLSILFLATLMDFFNVPILFKLGFKKGKIVTQSLPLILMLGVFAYLYFSGISMDADVANLTNYIQIPEINPLIILGVWVLLMVSSIFLSLKFYAKRAL